MKADFSRDTFHKRRHYRRVLAQQGRVVIDADRNEQTSIDIHVSDQTTADVIGPSGVPETSLETGYNGGFAIGLSADGSDLTIAHGRIYLDGVLVENSTDTTLSTQPYLPLPKGSFGPAGISGDGVYGVYLDAWERLVTPVDDPEIVETALGGPDTALRSQIAWQVKFGQIDTSEFGTNPVCAQILPPWGESGAGAQGKLAAQGGAPSTDPLPCVLPPQTGFRSLENQLYRVEIHTAGGYGTATFKWSRENGSVIAGIVSQLSGAYASPTFNVQTVGRDSTLGFQLGDWVELIDDTSEFQAGAGQLLQAGTVDGSAMTIALQTAPTLTIDATKHPKLRRWDQTTGATASGVPIVDGSWIDLENGVQVQFSNAHFNVGDYWLIPARTASSAATPGAVEWPIDPATSAPRLEGPRGIKHHYTKLAIVAYSGGTFSAPQGASAVTDCRIFFPPLTSIQSQSGPCTIVLQPGTNWTAPLQSFFTANPAGDAEICFAVGSFPVQQTVVIATTGNVKVTGAGLGTYVTGQGVETVLRFSGCASASICDLSVSAQGINTSAAATKHINGALEFDDCAEVRVEGVSLACGGESGRGAACLTVRSTITSANAATGAGTVRVYDSAFSVGALQYGMLIVHQARAFIERNELSVAGGQNVSFENMAKDTNFVKQFARMMVAGASTATAGSSSSSASSSSSSEGAVLMEKVDRLQMRYVAPAHSTSVSVGKAAVNFTTLPQLKNVFQTYLDQNAPKEFASNTDLLKYTRTAAEKLITDPAARAQYSEVGDVIRQLERSNVTVATRAIAVGGRAITELRVRDNLIDGFMQGIVVGVSHRETQPPTLPADTTGFVTISGNAIHTVVNPVWGYSSARYGIFVGNVNRLQIENNELTYTASFKDSILPADGIRVYGYLGKKIVVRHNDVAKFTRGVVINGLKAPGVNVASEVMYRTETQHGAQWLIADNVFESVRLPIVQQACMLAGNMYS